MNRSACLAPWVAWVVCTMAATTGHAVALYVAPDGDDGADGAQTTPWRTIQHAVDLAQPGDVITVQAGEYSEAVDIVTIAEQAAPIVLQAAPDARVLLRSPSPGDTIEALDLAEAAHWTVRGFEIAGGYEEAVKVRRGAHHVTISNCSSHDSWAGFVCENAHDVTFEGCLAERNETGGFVVSSGSVRIRFTRCRASNNRSGSGEKVKDTDGFRGEPDCADLTYEECVASDNEVVGFDVKGLGTFLLRCEAYGNLHGVRALTNDILLDGCHLHHNRDAGVIANPAPSGGPIRIMRCTIAENAQQGVWVEKRQSTFDFDPMVSWATGIWDYTHDMGFVPAVYDMLIVDSVLAYNGSAGLDFQPDLRIVSQRNVFYRTDPDADVIVLRTEPAYRVSPRSGRQGAWRNLGPVGAWVGNSFSEPR